MQNGDKTKQKVTDVARQRRRRNRNRNQTKLVIMRQPGRFMPDVLKCVLRYTDTVTQRSNIGAARMNFRYRSSAFDPDPLLLSGSIPGYTELAKFYRYYVVEKMTAEIEISNQETVGVVIAIWPSNVDYGNNSLTAAQLMDFSGNPQGQTLLLGSTSGMNRALLKTTASIDALYPGFGKTDLDFSALTSGNPTVQYYVNVGATTCIGNFGFPLCTRVVIHYHMRFYGIEQLDT